MIKNIVFDFGQVIVHYEPEYMVSKYVSDKDDIALLSEVVFDRLYWDRLDLGTITDEEVKSGIASRLPAEWVATAYEVYDHWIDNIHIIDGIEDAILAAKAHATGGVYLLSNISTQFVEGYPSRPAIKAILSHFDGLVFSGPLHLVKPDAAIFRHLLDTYGLSAEETLFIDDSPKNVAGAAAVGIKTYLFDGDAAKLTEYIKKNESKSATKQA